MAWFRILVLTLIFITPKSILAKDLKVCIVDSYKIATTQKLKEKLEQRVENELKEFRIAHNSYKCDISVLFGTPAVIDAIKKKNSKKFVYSFVLFPEALNLTKKENFYGVRIFPLPEKTAKVFYRYTGLERKKFVVPVSTRTLKIAKLYLPRSLFKIVVFKDRIEEVYDKLKNYPYIYIFPDPQVLKIVNLLNLIRYAKKHNKILISGLPDLKKYEINFIHSVNYDKLVDSIILLIQHNPKKKLLPCPARVEIWKH